jgi:citrate lyase subunit beta/citryl-CoA lyase
MDLAADLGAQPDADGTELLFVRSQVVVVSSALGLGAPVAPVQADYSDLERFARTTAALKRLGFASRACVHPCQVPVANEMFTPTAKEVDDAERLLSTFGAALAAGAGVMVSEGGEMVDEAAVRSARRVLARARPTSTGTTS